MLKELDWQRLDKILESGTREELDKFCSENGLEIKDGKIRARSKDQVKEAIAFWDKRQLVRKILLNS
jgi:hypothetical protein